MRRNIPSPWFAVIGLLVVGASVVAQTQSKEPPAATSPSPSDTQTPKSAEREAIASLEVTSTAFKNGESFPVEFTADGAGTSPALAWKGVPAGTKSIAIVMDDPDARGFVHWTVWNLPATCVALPAAITRELELKEPAGTKQGATSWGASRMGYWGSAPPPGSGPHRYTFTVFALDTILDLKAGSTPRALKRAIAGHVLAKGSLVGVYERPAPKKE